MNIGAYVSRQEVHRLHQSFEHVVRTPVHPMIHLNEIQVTRAVTLIQESWTFRRVAVDLNVSPSVIHRLWNRYDETDQFTRRVRQGRGSMTTPQDNRYLTVRILSLSVVNLPLRGTSSRYCHRISWLLHTALTQNLYSYTTKSGLMLSTSPELSCEKWTFKSWNGQQ